MFWEIKFWKNMNPSKSYFCTWENFPTWENNSPDVSNCLSGQQWVGSPNWVLQWLGRPRIWIAAIITENVDSCLFPRGSMRTSLHRDLSSLHMAWLWTEVCVSPCQKRFGVKIIHFRLANSGLKKVTAPNHAKQAFEHGTILLNCLNVCCWESKGGF